MPITKMIFHRPRPQIEMMTSISGRSGITSRKSVNRINAFPIRPPKYPAIRPTVVPMNMDMKEAAKPTVSETRAP